MENKFDTDPNSNTITKRRTTISVLDRALSNVFPDLNKSEIRQFRQEVIQYIANGLDNGYNIGLIKSEDANEINIKILSLLSDEGEIQIDRKK